MIPAISGPVREAATIASAWGSAAGLLFSWEPFDFGLRKANVALTRTLERQARAGAAGLAPSTGNWAAGLSVKFPLMEFKETQARRAIEEHQQRAESSRLEALRRSLRTQAERARAQLEAARRIAENTPVEIEAARKLVAQAEARYRAGLGTVVEVAEAQRLLRQAETDGALARLGVWQALFAVAAAEGNLEELVRRSGR